MESIFGIKSRISLLLLFPIILGVYYIPDLIIMILGISVVMTVVHIGYQLKWALRRYKKPTFKTLTAYPMISIHIPTHNEPAEVVIRTIQSCLRVDYPNYEIIVLDNNTTDEKLWKPVEQFCKKYALVKFRHYEKLSGFKAGALTKCLEITDPKAKYAFVVDADYQLYADSLNKAVGVAQGENACLVQFPQNYTSQDTIGGMNEEYNHYFKAFARGSNRSESMLSTGTLSLYSISAIQQVGGWKTFSITEDAEIGIKFHEHQLKTFYADILIGKGMLPNTLKDMRIQRERWAFGNIQCLRNLMFKKEVSIGKKIDIGIQLTAWVNFLGFSFLTLLSILMIFPFFKIQSFYSILYLVSINIGVYMIGKFFLFGFTTRFYSMVHFQTFLFHISMLDVHTFSWWDSMIGLKKPFKRTNKFLSEGGDTVFPIGLALLMTLMGICLIVKGMLIMGYVFIVFASINYMGLNLITLQFVKTTNYISQLNTVKP
ncbi:glycosyltransferase [Anditalea andensis]|uniref:Beta-monoglucosyldiacylglycerol synthase n=1 Tax=Anditalea andensis TaxID=1048983 RepID=A0A074LN49_9BACT|nr:glycosyltransferase [Anditalea andensis]KEO75337.1 hypothetical protein EL17_02010 [Anditalea andensis]